MSLTKLIPIALGVCLTPLAVAGPTFDLGGTGSSGTVSYFATPVGGGGSLADSTSGSQLFTPTSGSGQTGGGLLGVCDMTTTYTAVIADAFLPGDTLVTYHPHSDAWFNVDDYTGSVSSSINVNLRIAIQEPLYYALTLSGDLTGLTFTHNNGSAIVGDILAPGIYNMHHVIGGRAGTLPGYSATQVLDGTAQLFLSPNPVPAPTTAFIALLGLACVPTRRRPR